MDRQDYDRLADACLERIVRTLEPFDPDEVDYATSDGVVTIEFPDSVRYVLNRQAATYQMWFAAGARAWHFNWDAEKKAWIDDKEGRELFARIEEAVSAKIGRAVKL
ncbi:MAG: iron donor protein CyaY [Planctomycetota bacterium]